MLWAHNNDRVIISMLALHNLSSVGANISNRNCSVTSPCKADNQNTKNSDLRYHFIDPPQGSPHCFIWRAEVEVETKLKHKYYWPQ